MSNLTIKLKRGNKANLPSSAPVGEPYVVLDTREIYLGQGDGFDLIRVGATRADQIVLDPQWDLASDNVQEAIFEVKDMLTTQIEGLKFNDLVDVAEDIIPNSLLCTDSEGNVTSLYVDITPSYDGENESYYVYATSEDANHPAEHAFKHDTFDFWGAAGPASIGFGFSDGLARKIYKYSITAANDDLFKGPKSFVLEGGVNKDSALAVIDTLSGIVFNKGETKEFILAAPAEAAYFQLRVLELDGTSIGIAQIELIGNGLEVMLSDKAGMGYVDNAVSLMQSQIDSVSDRVTSLETVIDCGVY